MAKVDKKNPVEEIDDGIREKMIAVNRVTKVVKGGRILAFAALTVPVTATAKSEWARARAVKFRLPSARRWNALVRT